MTKLADRTVGGSSAAVGLVTVGVALVLVTLFSNSWVRAGGQRFGLRSEDFVHVEYSSALGNLKLAGNIAFFTSLFALAATVLLRIWASTSFVRTLLAAARALTALVGVLGAAYFLSEIRDGVPSWCFPIYLQGVTLVVIGSVLPSDAEPPPTSWPNE